MSLVIFSLCARWQSFIARFSNPMLSLKSSMFAVANCIRSSRGSGWSETHRGRDSKRESIRRSFAKTRSRPSSGWSVGVPASKLAIRESSRRDFRHFSRALALCFGGAVARHVPRDGTNPSILSAAPQLVAA